uniref:Acyclic terpene utilisation N-terminal domain-containing protein n=2 Tax=Poecilia mexicana TaxID=48701 RepID=A0A3B3YG29_9TELE
MSGLPRFLRFSPSNSERIWRRGSAEKCVSFSSRANFLRPGVAHPDSRGGSRWYSSCKPVRIGCASGFWGDTATSAPQLIYGGQLDFLVFDYLSEITMSLLTAARTKTPNLGYAPDFVQVALAPFINDIHRKGIRVVSNAGGVNPLACAEAIQEVVKKAGLDLKVAVVTGDDLMPSRSLLSEVKMADGGGRRPLPKTLHSMNAYLGAEPIRRCLDLGADVVVTGRCVDSAVALGPLLHTFGWKRDDYDLLAAGSLAGHLIECGAQSTGGIFTDWHQVPDWDNMGFPVVECSSDGSFVLSKPPKTGGLVSFGTVAEQLVYEIGDPRRYLLPDVICDFSQVAIQELPDADGGAVRVTGARGLAPSPDYKVCATYMDGFRATAVCPVGGPRAAEKARRTADSIIKRTRRMFQQMGLQDFNSVNVQVLGAEDTYGPNARRKDSREAVVWMAVHHKQKKALEVFSREVAPAGTGMAPGLTGIVGGRPRVSPVLKPFFFLHPKSQIKVQDEFLGQTRRSFWFLSDLPSGPHTYRLEDLAFTRSGDKGDSANIEVGLHNVTLWRSLTVGNHGDDAAQSRSLASRLLFLMLLHCKKKRC